MIGYLKGKIIQSDRGHIIVNVHDVGYRVEVGIDLLSKPIDEEVELYIHTNVSENDIRLIGFDSYEKLHLFQMLISINGIGPKAGVNIMSGLTVRNIKEAVLKKDPEVFKKVSGIGKKNAERIVLELNGKLEDIKVGDGSADSIIVSDRDELVLALKSLGYQSAEIESVRSKVGEGNISERLREALKLLSH